jgi:ribokinase
MHKNRVAIAGTNRNHGLGNAMTIFNLGSINADRFYTVPHLPKPGETLAATSYNVGLGGKGANQSIAAAKAGAKVIHMGAVGPDGDWAIAMLRAALVRTEHIIKTLIPTGHAIINVDPAGENAIVIFSSANTAQTEQAIDGALTGAQKGDYCILQNETNLVEYAANVAKAKSLKVIYSAAPFNLAAVRQMLPFIDILVLNEIESEQLVKGLGVSITKLPVKEVLITRGSRGSTYRAQNGTIKMPAFKVDPVDTTGAGDTFLGFFVAGLDLGKSIQEAMRFAAAAGAIQVTRKGTAAAIPDLVEVLDFLDRRAEE